MSQRIFMIDYRENYKRIGVSQRYILLPCEKHLYDSIISLTWEVYPMFSCCACTKMSGRVYVCACTKVSGRVCLYQDERSCVRVCLFLRFLYFTGVWCILVFHSIKVHTYLTWPLYTLSSIGFHHSVHTDVI